MTCLTYQGLALIIAISAAAPIVLYVGWIFWGSIEERP